MGFGLRQKRAVNGERTGLETVGRGLDIKRRGQCRGTDPEKQEGF